VGAKRPTTFSFLGRIGDPFVTAVVIAVVVMMVLPLPTAAIDLLIATSLAASVVLLMAAAGASQATRLATFPTLLLLTTLFRLGLNVSSTRLILLDADAGRIIDAFGHAVVRGNFVVGVILFVVITVVQYLVIARGAERVAEVAARFALDALPGKQLAIDADIRAGLIDHREARARRAALEGEAQLYGALDGAMKFVKGDAIAGIVIALVSIGGGLVIGIAQGGMSADDAFRTYAILTIGDGLVTQIPALLVSTAAGLLVTRVASAGSGSLGRQIGSEVLASPAPLRVAALFLAVLAVLPGLPFLPFAILAVLAALGSFLAGRRREVVIVEDPDQPPRVAAVVAPDLASLDLETPRQAVADRLGVPLPAVELVVDRALPAGGWRLTLSDVPVASGKGEAGPGLEAALSRHAHELLGTEEVGRLLDRLATGSPALVRDVTSRHPPRRLARVLAQLVEERISIRDLRGVLGPLVEDGAEDPTVLAEASRRALRRQITHQFAVSRDGERHLGAILVDPMIEEAIGEAVTKTSTGTVLALEPELSREILAAAGRALAAAPGAPIVTTAPIRRYTRRLVETAHPEAVVLAYEELAPDVKVEALARISTD
jgi:type III secretion protein V